METDEISRLVEELDQRVERLRVLYDQYFMGIEKIPPEVLKKDVERRVWALRHEKIRNTGIRFRFQQIIQRLNTFTSYWQRICRQIENGTYKRDVIRANKRFGPARATTSTESANSVDVELLDIDVDVEPEPESEPQRSEPSEAALEAEFPPIFPESEDPPPARPIAAKAPAISIVRPPGPPPARAPFVPAVIAAAQAAPVASAPTAPVAAERKTPAPAAQPARPSAPGRSSQSDVAARPAFARASSPRIPVAQVRNDDDLDAMLDLALGSKPAPAPSAPKVPAASPSAERPQTAPAASTARASAPTAPTAPAAPSAPKVAVAPSAMAPSTPRVPMGARVPAHAGGATTSPVNASAPAPQPPRAPAPAPAPAEARSSAQPAERVAPRPPTAMAENKPSTVPAERAVQRPSGPQRPPPDHAPADPDRQVYMQYVEARRKNGESTAGLTFETLAKNLRDTRERLKTKSGGRGIDFDVVVKDGKTILKPKVR